MRSATALVTLTALAATGLAGCLATAAPAAAVTPTNGRIVFDASLDDGNTRIWTMNPDGNRLVALTDGTTDDIAPKVSPDGRHIVFGSDRGGNFEIWTMDVDGSHPVQVTHDGQQDYYPSYSPDGSEIAYRMTTADDLGDVYVVPVAGGTPTRLTDAPGLDSLPSWSPDGTRIAFHSTRDDPDPTTCSDCVQAVYVMNADGSDQHRVAYDDGARDRFPTWSPDGTRIAYEHWDSTAQTASSHLWTIAVDGTGAAPVPGTSAYSGASSPAYSPDGTRLLFEQYGQLYAVPATGGTVTHVPTDTDDYVLSPDWSTVPLARQTSRAVVSSSPARTVWRRPTTLTAKIVGGRSTPTGTITFTQGATNLGTVGLDGTGTAKLTTSALEPFGRRIVARYSGDPTHTDAIGEFATVVDPASTATTLSVADGATIPFGSRVTARVRTLAPSQGVVDGYNASIYVNSDDVYSSAPITNGVAVLPATSLPAGSDTVRVCSPNTFEYTGSCSTPTTVTVTPATPRITLTAAPTSTTAGRVVTLTARITPWDQAGGALDFHDGDTDLGTWYTDATGVAHHRFRATTGQHDFTVTWAGDDNIGAATSNDVVVTVN